MKQSPLLNKQALDLVLDGLDLALLYNKTRQDETCLNHASLRTNS
jgi:hypothetical protein